MRKKHISKCFCWHKQFGRKPVCNSFFLFFRWRSFICKSIPDFVRNLPYMSKFVSCCKDLLSDRFRCIYIYKIFKFIPDNFSYMKSSVFFILKWIINNRTYVLQNTKNVVSDCCVLNNALFLDIRYNILNGFYNCISFHNTPQKSCTFFVQLFAYTVSFSST